MSAGAPPPCPLCDVDVMTSKTEAFLYGVLVGNVHMAEVAAERVCSTHRPEIIPGYREVIRAVSHAPRSTPTAEREEEEPAAMAWCIEVHDPAMGWSRAVVSGEDYSSPSRLEVQAKAAEVFSYRAWRVVQVPS